jgi:hypothetical protein
VNHQQEVLDLTKPTQISLSEIVFHDVNHQQPNECCACTSPLPCSIIVSIIWSVVIKGMKTFEAGIDLFKLLQEFQEK